MGGSGKNNVIHVILPVKGWEPVLSHLFQDRLKKRLLRNFELKEIKVMDVASAPEHFHILLRLPAKYTLPEILGWVKGESSHWFNLEYEQKFYWQKGYYAGRVSEDNINEITRYLDSHSLVHQNLTFEEEILKFRAGNLEERGYLPDQRKINRNKG